DMIVLLDEHGKEYSSIGFSEYIQKQMNAGVRSLTFVIGGAYGFSPAVYAAAHHKISLSQMTFNHQMVRLFFIEQLYRAHTILRHEKYHNA
ncbi:MAG: 23S rRNA (pseudouridine(1915)-N(3))-methyltransferase RlmH, partial [Bacteroidales bacterium]|nr:23S rRNA (pseudouridine(1915)-N(3))-methyltransferase RlmH [Bacteroidales bacterium]